ncbi:MAG: response regulator transcription factor [Alphaproteobacteria bacterium]|jgi:DNA-binding response OmpR family regulator|nr:response regulator transcription factor [Alphaproteobacteria bacterium]MDP7223495.1 response regulator transcription factor [Alphaproteobacteria bacterium]
MDTILLVDDDKLLRHMLKKSLEREDFLVIESTNGKRTLEVVRRHPIDLILLDIHLPDGSGLEFIHDIRFHTKAPVIIVSGDDTKNNKLDGLASGADDYVTKPVDVDVLLAKIKANIRRAKEYQRTRNIDPASTQNGRDIKCGNWTVDCDQFQIIDDTGKVGNLTVKEFELLHVLIQNAGKPLSREELCDALRKKSYAPTPRAIDVKIARLRKKLGDNATNPQIIKTIRSVGYMFHQDKSS